MSVAVAVLGVSVAAGAAAAPLHLDDALARARAANATVLAARAEVEAARGRALQARVLPSNPVVAGSLARHTGAEGQEVDREVSLAQEIEVGGQRGLRIAVGQQDVARAEFVLTDRLRAVEADVRRAFAGLLAAERRRALAAEAVAVADRLAATARGRARAGDVAALDVQLAEVEAARAAQGRSVAEAEQAAATARLASMIAADPDETLVVSADEQERVTPAPEDELVPRALARRPDLAAAKAERARLAAEAALTHRQGWVPNPVLRGFYRQEFFEERIAGGEVSVPLPLWNRSQGTETALRAAAAGAATEVERLTRDIPRQVRSTLLRQRVAAEAWRRAEHQALPAAQAARTLLERALAGGYLGLSEVLVQQDRVLQVRAAAIGAWLDLRTAEADLGEAVGGDVE